MILAAGASRRFGSSKMLYKLDNDQALLAKTIQAYSCVFADVFVVARSGDSDIVDLILDNGACFIDSPNADKGLSQSVMAGVIATTPTVGWLIALGDMPYVLPKTVKQVVQSMLPNMIVVPQSLYGEGNPIGFGVNFREELMTISGDVGAKPIVKRHAEQVIVIASQDLGIHQDIDTVNDVFSV